MKIILKKFILINIVVIFNFFTYAFDIDKHSPDFDQSVKAMTFDKSGTSYIYEESADMSSNSKLSYKVVFDDQEYLLPITRTKELFSQFGFLSHHEYYKTVFMLIPSENKLVLAYLPKESDKKFLTKEVNIGKYEGSLNSYKVIVSNGNLIIESGNNNHIYIFDHNTDDLKSFLQTSFNREITDYFHKDGQSYLLSIGEQASNENTVYLSVYNKDMSLIKEIEYISENKAIDSKFIVKTSTIISIAVQTFKKGSFPGSLISNIQKINFNLLKFEAVSVGHLFSKNIISNPQKLDDLVFCGDGNSIYWTTKTDDLRPKIAIKSNESKKFWIDLPKVSYAKEVFVSINDKKIRIMVNFGKRLGRFFTKGFGSEEIKVKCG